MATIHIQRSTLKAASLFMAKSDIRYYLNGILIESSPAETRAVATDGHALLARREARKDDNDGAACIIMPDNVVAAILKWKAPHKSAFDAPIVITAPADPNAEHRAEWCGQIAVFRPVDGKFPDYARIIPQSLSGESASFNADLLIKCQKAAIELGTNKNGYFPFKQNGESAAVATFGADAFAVIMPLRTDKMDQVSIDAITWGRSPVSAPPPSGVSKHGGITWSTSPSA
jgi:DNA polymerase-3 subunit beta